MIPRRLWAGVYPAVTTQFTDALALNLDAVRKRLKALIKSGIDGLVILGPCSEGNSLQPQEKRAVLDVATEAADGRLPIVAGICEPTLERALHCAHDAWAVGADALMVLSAPANTGNETELFRSICRIAEATPLPIMLQDRAADRRIGFNLGLLERLADISNIVAISECDPDPRRLADMIDTFGDRYTLMVGRDGIILEGLASGAKGWVSGLASAFPKEATALVRAYFAGRIDEAQRIHRWFAPLFCLDEEKDLVQSIKLAEQMTGRGSEHVRMPRQPLSGARRSEVIAVVDVAFATRPGRPLWLDQQHTA